ncbi:hypothetical protein BYI23_B004680 [Burkholderia sp. YI23]|nr:hypothetical protein BYI23_B004680 [Burkholderia sp. YI23]
MGGSAGGAAGAAGAGGAGAATGGASGSAAGASALASGSQVGTVGTPTDFIPEKYRVLKDDGSFDMDASARKLAEAHGNLTKRMVDGGAPPAAPTDYTVTVPDALKESLGDLSNDKLFTSARDKMHSLGLTQKQFDGVMEEYFKMAPALAGGGQQLNAEQATEQLRATWKDDAEFKKNVGLSYNAASKVAEAAGLTYDDIEKAGLGNNPTFVRLMAAIGPEFSEDSLPNEARSAGFATDDEIKQLMLSDANTNPKNPQHKATRARIDAYYARKHGTAPVV